MFINDVRVVIEKGPFSDKEAEYYINKIQRHSPKYRLKTVSFKLAEHHLDLRYSFEGIPFERLRRVSLTTQNERKVVGR